MTTVHHLSFVVEGYGDEQRHLSRIVGNLEEEGQEVVSLSHSTRVELTHIRWDVVVVTRPIARVRKRKQHLATD